MLAVASIQWHTNAGKRIVTGRQNQPRASGHLAPTTYFIHSQSIWAIFVNQYPLSSQAYMYQVYWSKSFYPIWCLKSIPQLYSWSTMHFQRPRQSRTPKHIDVYWRCSFVKWVEARNPKKALHLHLLPGFASGLALNNALVPCVTSPCSLMVSIGIFVPRPCNLWS